MPEENSPEPETFEALETQQPAEPQGGTSQEQQQTSPQSQEQQQTSPRLPSLVLLSKPRLRLHLVSSLK
jgi:hypothetical protein